MDFKKIIREEIGEWDWIKDSRPTLHNKIIVFEPMIDFDEYKKVRDKLIAFNGLGDNIRWWTEKDLIGFNPMDDTNYLHHLIIASGGRMVFGSLDSYEVQEYLHDGYTEDEIRNLYDNDEDIDLFIDEYPREFDNPERIDGRKYFDLPYIKSINESEDFFNSLRDDENKPKIIPGGIIDTLVGNFSRYEILQRLHELGYEWLHDMKIFVDGELSFAPFRYIFIGPIGGNVAIGELKLLHDDDLNWINSEGLSDLVYRT